MATKWTAKDAIRCLAELRNPFEKSGEKSPLKISDMIKKVAGQQYGNKETTQS